MTSSEPEQLGASAFRLPSLSATRISPPFANPSFSSPSEQLVILGQLAALDPSRQALPGKFSDADESALGQRSVWMDRFPAPAVAPALAVDVHSLRKDRSMSEDPEVDRIRSLVGEHAQRCLEGLQQAGDDPRPEAALLSSGRWAVLLAAFPPSVASSLDGLGECHLDCLAVLAGRDDPLPAVRLQKELEKQKGVYSIATVNRALARLKALNLIGNNKKSPRGYYLKLRPTPLCRRLDQLPEAS
jgi:hypothetical protein